MKRRHFMQSVAGTVAGSALVPGLSFGRIRNGPQQNVWPPVDPGDEHFWNFLRGEFPLMGERAYLNTGGLGASPFMVIDAVKAKMDELEKISEPGHEAAILERIKVDAGRLLGCDANELAFTRNTTEGINIVAHGLPLRSGDEVITSTQEHVANIFTWLVIQKRRGIVLKFFEPSAETHQENLKRIEKLITKRTRLISIAHALTTTGTILPVRRIAELAMAHKIWFFIDGAQTAGMFPFNLHEIGCDAFATSGHKWLLGPKETGLLYVRRDMLDTIDTKFVGAYSDNGFDVLKGTFALHPGAQRYEYGTVSVPLRVGLGAAIGFLEKIGMENVWKRDQALSTRLFNGLREMKDMRVLSPADDTMRSAMVTFMHDRIPYLELQEHLNTYNLRTRSVSEGGLAALRVSTHVYNTFDEVDRVLEGVRTAVKK